MILNFSRFRIFLLFSTTCVLACAPSPRPVSSFHNIAIINSSKKIPEKFQISLFSKTSIPYLTKLKGKQIGGFSGLSSTGKPFQYWMISDDQKRASSLYRVRIQIKPKLKWKFLGQFPLKDQKTPPYLDSEGIVYNAQQGFLIATEGSYSSQKPSKQIVPPRLLYFSKKGEFIKPLPLPPTHHQHTFLQNKAFESLTLSPSKKWLFTATELPLKTQKHIKILRYKTPKQWGEKWKMPQHYLYPIERYSTGQNGLTAMLSLSKHSLLTLERAFFPATGSVSIRIFQVFTKEKKNKVIKKLVFDLEHLGIELDNFEAMEFGPKLPNGHRSLMILSDNNFNPFQQNLLLLLELKPAPSPLQ